MILWGVFAAAVTAALLLTWLLRRYAIARSLLDIPNERSSHTVPTPRGGGVAIVVTFSVTLALIAWAGVLPETDAWALLGAGAWVALVGFLDDHGHIPASRRLIAHFAGSIWALAWLGGLPPLLLFGFIVDFGWVGDVVAAIYLVWLLNLYNFMDGIDGVASVEAICVCLGGALLYVLTVPQSLDWAVPVLLLFVVAGFLFWNFPPAKIFMGDAGSGFLGMVLGIFSIQAAWVVPELLWSWIILLGVFVVDATVTLVRRIWRGEKFYEAHRSHAYQYASRRLGAHRPVTLAVLTINLGWLLPLALLVALGTLEGVLGVMIAYLPLLGLAYYLKAGARELQEV